MKREVVTIQHVAEAAGVSTATVSFVLRGSSRFSAATVQRVREAAEQLGYTPNAAARALAMRSGRMLALVVADLGNPFFGPVLRGAEEAAARHGFIVVVADSARDKGREADHLQRLADHGIDGLILSPVAERDPPPLRSWRQRCVLVNRRLEGQDLDLVTTDNRHGGWVAGRQLLASGHRRVAVVSGSTEVSTHRDRLDGVALAFAERGVPFPEDLVVHTTDDVPVIYRATGELLRRTDDPPSALFATSGIHATAAYQAVLEAGLRIPADISFLAFDQPSWTVMVTPAISTVVQPGTEMGRRAVEILMGRLRDDDAGPRCVTLEPVFEERGSITSPMHKDRPAA